MDQYTPTVDSLQHTYRADGAGNYRKVTALTFHVGKLGPFYYDFAEGQDSSANVNTYMQQKASELRILNLGS